METHARGKPFFEPEKGRAEGGRRLPKVVRFIGELHKTPVGSLRDGHEAASSDACAGETQGMAFPAHRVIPLGHL